MVIARAFRNLFTHWLLQRHRATEQQTDYQGLDPRPATLDAEYERVIAHQLARLGVRDGLVSVQMQQTGPRRKPAFSAVLTVHEWERDSVPRVLLGLPLLERKVRRAVANLWIADVSTFGGLLLKVSPHMQDTAVRTQLRQLLVNITGAGAQPYETSTSSGEPTLG